VGGTPRVEEQEIRGTEGAKDESGMGTMGNRDRHALRKYTREKEERESRDRSQ
jgi:hypothetical protein